MKYYSKLTYQLSFWNVSRKVDYHAGGKWFIHARYYFLFFINCLVYCIKYFSLCPALLEMYVLCHLITICILACPILHISLCYIHVMFSDFLYCWWLCSFYLVHSCMMQFWICASYIFFVSYDTGCCRIFHVFYLYTFRISILFFHVLLHVPLSYHFIWCSLYPLSLKASTDQAVGQAVVGGCPLLS